MVNYTDDGEGRLTIHDLMLTDFDLSWQGDDSSVYSSDHHIGHYLWQSLEAMASKNVSKPSDVFAYGLMVSATVCLRLRCSLIFVSRPCTF